AEGLYYDDSFLDSFLELSLELERTATAGKQLAVVWEHPGCPYCRDMHLINFAEKSIETYIRTHFEVVQLNLRGSRVVVDFDGEKLGERQFAAKYGVRATPVVQVFPDRNDLGLKAPRARGVNRIYGHMRPRASLIPFPF